MTPPRAGQVVHAHFEAFYLLLTPPSTRFLTCRYATPWPRGHGVCARLNTFAVLRESVGDFLFAMEDVRDKR